MKKRIYTICLVIASLAIGCKKLVEIPPPSDKIVTATVFNNNNTALAAQFAVYAQMQALPFNLDTYAGLSSDELITYSTNQTAKNLYINGLNNADATNLFWNLGYKYIYQENAVIESCQASKEISIKTRDHLVGEAKFTRALLYFYLVNFYGDAPLITTTDYKKNAEMPRTPKATVYQQIINDLKEAKNLLSSNYLDATDTVITKERVRPISYAASALMARAYLYTAKYDSAEVAASSVINNNGLFGMPTLDSVFLANSRETIWQIQAPSAWTYTYEGNYFSLTKAPNGNTLTNTNAINIQLLNAFEAGDNRKNRWIASFTSSTNTWYYPAKYKDKGAVAPPSKTREYSMVLRLAEQYLIRAEARAQQNKLPEAINDLNVIRTRAGLLPLSSSLSQQQVLTAIAHERQVELFTEAHRWLDLKRNNSIDAVMTTITNLKGGTWKSYQQLYPLPAPDLQNGINLIQNVGY